jgi:ABC-2 type transport system permease protein
LLRRIYAIVKKEFRQIRRDPRTLLLIFIFPVFLLVLFGYALNFDVKHIKVAIYDEDKSKESRDFVEMLGSSGYFDIVGYLRDKNEVNKYLDQRLAQCVVVLPIDMSEKINSNSEIKLQFLIDGVDGNTATIVMNYMNAATGFFSQKVSREYLMRTGNRSFIPLDAQLVFWYNPDLNTTKFLIPGLLSMILILTAVILTCLSIVKEKELGSMEQIKVSPVGSLELIIGKTIPYTFVALMVAAFTLLLSYVIFKVEIKGSMGLLFISTLLFLIAALSIGIFISTIAESQQVAFQIASLATMLPTFILSGFVFPIESMPWPIQILTNITPAKFYIIILRDIMIKGVGIGAFWKQIASLAVFAFIFLTIATIRTKRAKAV